jgi:hypothetical protein
MRTGPYMIGVWQPSLKAAAEFVDTNMLGRDVVQFVQDNENKWAYWVMLAVTGDQRASIKEFGAKLKPRMTVIP